MTLPWPSRAPSPVTHALAVERNRTTVRLLSRCVCFCFFDHLFFSCHLFCLFTLFLLNPRMYLLPVCIQLNSTYEACVAVAVPMSTYEGCCCCTYDLQHSPSWLLLLLLLIVDQLVYHAVLLFCYIYHPAHAFYF